MRSVRPISRDHPPGGPHGGRPRPEYITAGGPSRKSLVSGTIGPSRRAPRGLRSCRSTQDGRPRRLAAAWRNEDIMDRLKPLDALFVEAEDEDPHTSMAIASIAVFEGPPPSHEEFLAFLAGRLPLVPLYRRKLRVVPFRLGWPVWVDDPDFDLRYHVRRTALPAPGGDKQLADLMARVMSQRLDRDRPLWEYWVIEGLAGERDRKSTRL